METFLIGGLSAGIVAFMYYTLGGRNTLYVFVAISILGVFIGIFEDIDFTSEEYFTCSNTDGRMVNPKIATLVINEAKKTVKFQSFVENKIYADLKYTRDQTNEPEIYAFSQSKDDGYDIESIRFDRNTQQMRMYLGNDTDNPFYYYQCRQSNS
mgnify:CR=1 FL=1